MRLYSMLICSGSAAAMLMFCKFRYSGVPKSFFYLSFIIEVESMKNISFTSASPTIPTTFVDIRSFETQDDCNKIMMPIENCYKRQIDFNLILETNNLSIDKISIKSVYRFSSFLNSLKKHKYQYLKKTKIKIYNNYCYELLYFLFMYLSSPVAIVEVILYNNSNIEKIKMFFPKN